MDRNQLEKLKPDQLAKKLSDMGFGVSGNISKDGLIDQLLRIVDDNLQDSVSINRKAIATYKRIWTWNKKLNKDLPEDPMIEITFRHDDGDKELEFNYAGPLGKTFNGITYKMPVNNDRWTEKNPKWKFIHGKTYTIPFSLYNHLNSLVVKDQETLGETESGTPITREVLRKRVGAEHVPNADFFAKEATNGKT